MSIRTERVASLMKEELGAILSREYSSPSYGFITVTDVRMTADLKIARVAVSIFGNDKVRSRTMAMLESEKPRIRGIVGSHVRLRYTPSLLFLLDDSLDAVDRINRLIKKIHNDERKPDASS